MRLNETLAIPEGSRYRDTSTRTPSPILHFLDRIYTLTHARTHTRTYTCIYLLGHAFAGGTRAAYYLTLNYHVVFTGTLHLSLYSVQELKGTG